jgi:hypothetical protein
MAIPVILAETLTITELFIIYNRQTDGMTVKINKFAGILFGFYFTGIFIYLLNTAAIPLTLNGEWNTWIDVVAVGSYLSGVLVLLPIALMELGIIFRNRSEEDKMKLHYRLISGFIVVSHVAMVFGMLNPGLFK